MPVNLLLILCVGIGFAAVPLGIGIYHLSRTPKREDNSFLDAELFAKTYVATIYTFGPDIQSLDDLNAARMGVYRDTGQIQGLAGDDPVLRYTVHPDRIALAELHAITRSALEVKRINEKELYYFFNGIRELTVNSPRMKGIYSCLQKGAALNQAMLLKLSTEPDMDDAYGL